MAESTREAQGAKTILAADDDPVILDVVRSCLQRDGLNVITAEDGEQALAAAREHRPDLVVLDVMMPKRGGIEVLQELRRDPDLSGIPVIMLSARAQDADLDRGFEAGATDYVVKPFNPEELRERVRAQLVTAS